MRVSKLGELTREELMALVLRLHKTVPAQKPGIAELEPIAQRQAKLESAADRWTSSADSALTV